MSSVSQILDLAVKFHQAGNLHEAEVRYRQVLQIEPRHPGALHLLGLIAHQVGRSDLAVDYIQEALRLRPDFAPAHSNLAMALRDLGKLDEAIAHYQEALRLQPDFPEACNNFGVALQDQGRIDQAIARFEQAARLKPDFAEAYVNLGNAQQAQGMHDAAIASCQQALRLRPDSYQAYNNLGNAQRDKGHFDEAIASFRQALRLRPEYTDAHSNLGRTLKDQGRLDEALASFREALRLEPDHADAHFNRSSPLLLQGNFAEGWAEYEWRWRTKAFLTQESSRAALAPKAWDGSPLQGRTILLHGEQGLGDTIQFVRYAALLKQQGAGRVLLACPPELQRLLQRCEGIDQVFSTILLPDFDVGVFLLSLPRLLGTTAVERIPADIPYINVDLAVVAHWEARLGVMEGQRPLLRIGIVWQGNPSHNNDRRRSVRPEEFAPLAQLAGVRLVSLQKGTGSDQLAKMPDLAVNLGPELTDLADTAAVIRCLDLVITVDTAVAHLAGALGTPVWVALPLVPDWRWLLQREDSPWYPSMRLFRQAERGQWDDVFRRITNALAAFAVQVGGTMSPRLQP